MSEIIPGRERKKAAFLAAYRRVCEEFGMMAIQVSCDGYCPMAVIELHEDPALLDRVVEEMRIERLRTAPPAHE